MIYRDPVRSQKMMKGRVASQFITLMCFLGYAGSENADWRIAPMFQDVQKWKEIQKQEEEEERNKQQQQNFEHGK